jgi:hypothetical protein
MKRARKKKTNQTAKRGAGDVTRITLWGESTAAVGVGVGVLHLRLTAHVLRMTVGVVVVVAVAVVAVVLRQPQGRWVGGVSWTRTQPKQRERKTRATLQPKQRAWT